jgi:hypothetical protein
MVIDFPYPIVITEIHSVSFGKYKSTCNGNTCYITPIGYLNFWFVDPVS